MSTAGYTKVLYDAADSRFPSFQQGFNRRFSAPNLAAVYLCETAAGTAAALDAALATYGGGIKIKCGGHCYEGFVFDGETRAVLDVTPMGGAGFDSQRGFYLDAGGTNWGAFQALFRDFGKVLPGGSCYSVGLGGHICGGGYGLLSRLFGLTVDWLTGVEIVVKDDDSPARVLYVSTESTGDEADLFWALRGGGGGNFGIITRYYFAELPDAPQEAALVTLGFSWPNLTAENLGALLGLYAEIAASQENPQLFGLFKLMHQAAGEIQVIFQVVADSREAIRAAHADHIAPLSRRLAEVLPHHPPTRPMAGHPGWLLSLPKPTIDPQWLTFYEAVQTLNGSGPNQRGKYKSAYMRKPFPQDQVEAIFTNLQKVPAGLDASAMTQSLLQVDTYGGVINNVSPTATAIPQRSSILKLQYQTYWQNAADDQAFLGWIRDFYADVYAATGGIPDPDRDPSQNVDGCYYNYPDVDLNDYGGRDGALHLYFLGNFRQNPRNLVAVKKRWDPADIFHSSQSIPTS